MKNRIANCLCYGVILAMTTPALAAQTLTTLQSFDGPNGSVPEAALVQGTDGAKYGVTTYGGTDKLGTIFRITPSGTLTTLYSFSGSDGKLPIGGLVQGIGGNFYGTTWQGGANAGSYGTGGGTIFKVTPSGTLTTLYNFCSLPNCTDGEFPEAALIQASNGNFYGTTSGGGNDSSGGTVFKMTPSGTLTPLYSFCINPDCPDGYSPEAALIQATNGNLYGTTVDGGANGMGGTVFKITLSGALTTLHSFCSKGGSLCSDGEYPSGALVQASNGDFYGTTDSGGGVNGHWGSIFSFSPSTGILTSIHSFCSVNIDCSDGAYPESGLVQAVNGDFYGTTYGGGNILGYGTLFQVSRSGTLTTLYTFSGGDGNYPYGLIESTNGTFYGPTAAGGAYSCFTSPGCGTIFNLSIVGENFGPFVETQTTFGRVGDAVEILGTDLINASSVYFAGTATVNGTPAVFTVASNYSIKATVPVGATTGKVQVVLPGSTLSSNVPFQVIQ
jgi:uncharacterized repeat protein (TIGR03803 family)